MHRHQDSLSRSLIKTPLKAEEGTNITEEPNKLAVRRLQELGNQSCSKNLTFGLLALTADFFLISPTTMWFNLRAEK